MATYQNTRTLVTGARGFDLGFIAAITNFGTTFSNWNKTRITRKELNKLSDHALEDIGLCRADIAAFTAR